MIVLRKRN